MNTNTTEYDDDDHDADDDVNVNSNSNNSLDDDDPAPPTFHETIEDLANWWCHFLLQQKDLELFEQLEPLLEILSPLESHSSLCIRLHCLAVWQELLKQTVGQRRKRQRTRRR